MRTVETRAHAPAPAAGFTLPAVLVVVGGLLILAVGILLVASIERSTARSFVDRERAELAARAGLEDIRGILATEAANDDFLVIRSQTASPIDTSSTAKDRKPAPFLFLARGKTGGNTFRYVPLFSTTARPADANLAAPAVDPLLGATENERIDFQTLPYQDKVRTAWLPVQDEKGRTVGRYAYWVEDLQGRLDPTLAGNQDGNNSMHVRAAWPFPAAGLNPDPPSATEPALNQAALFAMDPAATEENQGSVGKTLFRNRKALISPDSTLAAAGFTPPLTRLESVVSDDPFNPAVKGAPGQLSDRAQRAVEEGLFPGIQPYKERPLIPFADGIDPSVSGTPKLNLNQLLATGGNTAVDQMAELIRKALPKFDQRKGGFPDDYIKTLASNAIDYADTDGDSTTQRREYRGLDAYPLISEFLMTFKWVGAGVANGQRFVDIEVGTFVELWNMTNLPVSGEFRVTAEPAYKISAGVAPVAKLDEVASAVTPPLETIDGYKWYPGQTVSLKSNEYRVFRAGIVTYRVEVAPVSVTLPANGVGLIRAELGASGDGYRMMWNGRIVDESRGSVHRNDSTGMTLRGEHKTRTTIPGHSYKARISGAFIDNMGDPRMSAYLLAPQDASAYPQNYSPNRRNIRGAIYHSDDDAAKRKLFGRVMPSEWPDGGHNSFVGTLPISGAGTSMYPDHPTLLRILPSETALANPSAEEAPFRLSNEGRFYSVTELGRVYDPIMWKVGIPSGPNLPYGDVLSTTPESTNHGGGNTLRIGRPEHPKFDDPNNPGLEAWRLIDLFHVGISRSGNAAEREGNLNLIEGFVNLNTASRATLRALAFGALVMDPKIAKRTDEKHLTSGLMAPPVSPYKPSPGELAAEADRIADAIIELRSVKPLASPAEIAEARVVSSDPKISNLPVFGNKELYSDGSRIHRSDSAAEEVFARVFEASTVRSRNFRVWVVAQSLAPTNSPNAEPEVLAEVRRAFTIFADPGERSAEGRINPDKVRVSIRHENDF